MGDYDIEVAYFATSTICIRLRGVSDSVVDNIFNLLSQVCDRCDIWDLNMCIAYQK